MSRPLICLSHLRWDFVYQRPNHLMARAARTHDVIFVEEPVADGSAAPDLERIDTDGLTVLRPHVPATLSPAQVDKAAARLLREHLAARDVRDPVLWYYTPMALPWTEGIPGAVTVYDCMDELSAFRGAPPSLVERERRLVDRADLVFTGGRQLFEAKRFLHPAVHLFPSSVDRAHFARARRPQPDPADQVRIGRPRIGFFGVIDERIDLALVAAVARRRPAWQFVLVGPVAKIDESEIPALPNVHHLGRKAYGELPAYLAGWDVAMMPFAHNEATRFISPTKTPEYLAGGKPVVSTSIRDVVEPYGRERLARIADTPATFEAAIAAALAEDGSKRVARADAFLARLSWEQTWTDMERLVRGVELGRRGTMDRVAASRAPIHVPASPGAAAASASGRRAVTVPTAAAIGAVPAPVTLPLAARPGTAISGGPRARAPRH